MTTRWWQLRSLTHVTVKTIRSFTSPPISSVAPKVPAVTALVPAEFTPRTIRRELQCRARHPLGRWGFATERISFSRMNRLLETTTPGSPQYRALVWERELMRVQWRRRPSRSKFTILKYAAVS
jgi:hypothetical protein